MRKNNRQLSCSGRFLKSKQSYKVGIGNKDDKSRASMVLAATFAHTRYYVERVKIDVYRQLQNDMCNLLMPPMSSSSNPNKLILMLSHEYELPVIFCWNYVSKVNYNVILLEAPLVCTAASTDYLGAMRHNIVEGVAVVEFASYSSLFPSILGPLHLSFPWLQTSRPSWSSSSLCSLLIFISSFCLSLTLFGFLALTGPSALLSFH